MSLFFIVLRETLEYSIILLLLCTIFKRHTKSLVTVAVLTVISGMILTWTQFPLPDFLRKVYTGFMFFSFIMVLLLAFVSDRRLIFPLVALVLMLFFPSAQLTSVALEELYIKGPSVLIYVFSSLLVAVGILYAGFKYLFRFDFEKFFGSDGIFIFLSGFCFVFGGLNEFDHLSVITTLQRGFYVLSSSLMPFLKSLFLLPDGTMMRTTIDSVLEYSSSQRVAMAVTALILFLPPLFVFGRLLLTPEPETESVDRKAVKRKIIALYRYELIRKGAPLLIALIVSIVLLHSANLSLRPTYEPEPVPLIAGSDRITVPLIDKFGDVSDGKMRKYSFLHEGETYRFIVIMRPDGEVVAVLDACEICPPRGYVQRAEHVICKYCNTPIPSQSLGQPGGCNPIPVKYRVEGDTLIVSKSEIVQAYKQEAGKETGSLLR